MAVLKKAKENYPPHQAGPPTNIAGKTQQTLQSSANARKCH
jgi:hypothetical protein